MGKLFGTDGIRGRANTYPINSDIALKLGRAIAMVFGSSGHGSCKAVLGKDTRLSGYMLETALTSGLLSMGMDVLAVGPMPTPAVAHLTRSLCASCGIMITASHNPAEDNGIKIFGADGFKLPDDVEAKIEALVLNDPLDTAHIANGAIGKAFRIDDARGRYIEFAKSSIKNRSIKGMKVILDCANGAAYSMAPAIFRELGAEVIEVACSPDGLNINNGCGALHIENASRLVREHNADLGISLDGDADRVIFCDADGNEVNGDRIIGMVALDFQTRHRLVENSVVVTQMSNLGLQKALNASGIRVIYTDIGDRYVIEEMRAGGYNIGGEQSGHVIFMDYVTTGDGIITALHVLELMARKKRSLKELAAFMPVYPQGLRNLPVKEKRPLNEVRELKQAIRDCEKALGESGRTLVRYSGTENKLRLLVEAEKSADVDYWLDALARAADKALN